MKKRGGNHREGSPIACVMGTLNTIRPLGEAGIDCAVFAPEGSPALYSRFNCTRLDWDAPAENPEGCLEKLEAFGRSQKIRPALFFEDDHQLLLVSRHRDRLAKLFRFSLADPELIDDLTDKSRFLDFAVRHVLPVPEARYVEPYREDPPSRELRFPLIVKEAVHSPDWKRLGLPGKACLVNDAEELRALWSTLRQVEQRFLVQEFIAGPEDEIESYHTYIDADGKVAAEFTGKKIRTYPKEFGFTTALIITDAADVLELGRTLALRIGLRGVAKFDFKRAPDGSLHLLEVNPRFNLWHLAGALAGVNLPATVYADLAGIPRPAVARARPGVRWCDPVRDYKAARVHGLSMTSWLLWLVRCEAVSNIAVSDPMPVLKGGAKRALMRVGRTRSSL